MEPAYVLSYPGELRKLIAKEYTARLKSIPVRPDLQQMGSSRNYILSMKLKLAETNSSKPWTISDLERALGDLKNNKSETQN